MNKPLQAAGLVVAGLVTITIASPALEKLAHATVPVIVTLGATIAVLRLVWFYTR